MANETGFSNLGASYSNMSDGSENQTFFDYPCYTMRDPSKTAVINSHIFFVFSSLIFVIFGLIGNTLTLAVFSSKEMRPISSNFYLLVLAISDSMYLICVFIGDVFVDMRCLFIKDYPTLDIKNNYTAACKLIQFLCDFFSDYSSTLIMAFTIERFIAVYQPIKFKEICTLKRAQLTCLALIVIIAVFSGPGHLLYMGVHPDYTVCIIDMNHESTFGALYIAEAFLFRVVPVFIIAALNVFIIVRVTQVTRERRRRKARVKSVAATQRAKQQDKSMQLTIMLILVSTSYILLFIPVLIHFVMNKIYFSNRNTENEPSYIDEDTLLIAENYIRALYVMGFAINFFLYTVSGRVFRDQLEMILCSNSKNNKKRNMANGTEMTNLV